MARAATTSDVFNAIAEPCRRNILVALGAGEAPVADLVTRLRLTQPQVSKHLGVPREVVRHELPESERVCPHDGAVLREIGVEASEQLDIIPQQVRVIRHERVKYACPCCDGGLRLAGKPPQIIPKGLFLSLIHISEPTRPY